MANFLNKAANLLLAGNYPANRLNKREAKVLQTAEEYSPAVPGNWGSTPPATQDAALDALSASGAGSPNATVNISAVYDFSVNGGSVGNKALGISIPSKAIITSVYRDVLTAVTSSGSNGTLLLSLPTDGQLEQTALTASGSNTGVSSSGGTAVPVKTTAVRALQVTVGTSAITAGRVRYFISYKISE